MYDDNSTGGPEKYTKEQFQKMEKERFAAEARENAKVDAEEKAYRKKHNIGPEVKGYQHMIAAEAEEKALRQKAIEDLTNKKGTNLNKEAARGGGGGGAGIPKVGPKRPLDMKKGGVVSSASKRADGCAMRGKTRGRVV
jgi:membrane protein involved in colicin uptake